MEQFQRMAPKPKIKMGAGGSTAVSTEQGKPLDASDVDTPRGVSAKDEVKRLRTLLSQYDPEELRATEAAQVVSRFIIILFRSNKFNCNFRPRPRGLPNARRKSFKKPTRMGVVNCV